VATTLLPDGDLWLSGDVATTLVSWRLDDVVMSSQFEVEAVDNSSWNENVEFSKISSDSPLLVRQVTQALLRTFFCNLFAREY
jgi:hypothetical protein